MSNVDLNALRDNVLNRQKKGEAETVNPAEKIYVDREAGIKLGRDTGKREQRNLSEVQTDTFEASRLRRDRKIVKTKFPANTREIKTREGVTGWLYEFTCQLGRRYRLFAYFDGANYQVKVIEPQLEDYWKDAHTGHLFANGNICFGGGHGSGRASLEAAYAKSVLWANGISIALATGKFPFNHNQ